MRVGINEGVILTAELLKAMEALLPLLRLLLLGRTVGAVVGINDGNRVGLSDGC